MPSGGGDPYVQPNGVLKNRLNITDATLLARAEADLSSVRAAGLEQQPVTATYDLAHLQAIHRRLFEPVYDWAGELRSVDIAKAQMFCRAHLIEPFARELFGRLHRQQLLQGRGPEELAEGLAGHLADVNALHPFREGNGRTQRVYASQLARDAGFQLGFNELDPEENNHAFIASMDGDERPLRALLAARIQPLQRDAPTRLESDRRPPAPLLERVLGPRPDSGSRASTWDRADRQLEQLADRIDLPREEIDRLTQLPDDPRLAAHVNRVMERLAEQRDVLGRRHDLPEPVDLITEHVADLALDLDRGIDR